MPGITIRLPRSMPSYPARATSGAFMTSIDRKSRVCATPAMQKLMTYEHALVRTPPAQQFEVLRQMGAPVATETFGSNTPRRGVMPI